MDGIKEEDWREVDDCKAGPETVTGESQGTVVAT